MKNYKSNLNARDIQLDEEDIQMVATIVKKKLKNLEPYPHVSEEIKTILRNNVLIVATTDRVKRAKDKVDIIIGNIPDAIKLVMQDAKDGSSLTE